MADFDQVLPSKLLPSRVFEFQVGGLPGAFTIPGIQPRDVLLLVQAFNGGVVAPILDLTSEFSITADNTIDNTGGTDTTGLVLHVLFYDRYRKLEGPPTVSQGNEEFFDPWSPVGQIDAVVRLLVPGDVAGPIVVPGIALDDIITRVWAAAAGGATFADVTDFSTITDTDEITVTVSTSLSYLMLEFFDRDFHREIPFFAG